jgi:DNA-directed RNA polymerase specialized sigma24 family protein
MEPDYPGTSTLELEDLLHRIRRGDEAAKHELIERAFHHVERLASVILKKDFPNADPMIRTGDVMSIAYPRFAKRMLEGLERVPENKHQLLAYNQKIIINALKDMMRSEKGPKRIVVNSGDGLPPDDVLSGKRDYGDDAWMRLRLLELFEKLDPEDGLIIGASWIHEWSDREIADEFQLAEEDVQPRIDAILRRLKILYDTLGPDE